jgi:nitroimidazol reductase NimA-like FMN-containing flavoprotein (pyridoxamine 5'-phosphate oxidase superfamily)
MSTRLSPTPRSTLRRKAERSVADREALHAILDEALICHLGVVVDGEPLVVPTTYGYDLDGADEDGTLYLHGSVASASLLSSTNAPVCATFTLLDGLVLARSGFHHSMNYRSAVVRGQARVVDDPD